MAAVRLDFVPHAEDSYGLINGGPKGQGYFCFYHIYIMIFNDIHNLLFFATAS